MFVQILIFSLVNNRVTSNCKGADILWSGHRCFEDLNTLCSCSYISGCLKHEDRRVLHHGRNFKPWITDKNHRIFMIWLSFPAVSIQTWTPVTDADNTHAGTAAVQWFHSETCSKYFVLLCCTTNDLYFEREEENVQSLCALVILHLSSMWRKAELLQRKPDFYKACACTQPLFVSFWSQFEKCFALLSN